MKFFNDRKIITKILSLVTIMTGLMGLLALVSGNSVNELKSTIDRLALRSDLMNASNDMLDAQSILMYSEVSIAVKDTAESVHDAETRADEYKKIFSTNIPFMIKNSDEKEAEFLSKIQSHYDDYIAQIEKTLVEAKAIYIARTKEDDSIMKASMNENEKTGRAMMQLLWDLNEDMNQDIEAMEKDAIALAVNSETTVWTISGIIVIFGFIMGYILAAKGISKPLSLSVDVLKKLADNDLDVEVTGIERKDEIGDVARAAEFFKESLIKQKEMIETEKREQILKEMRQSRVQELISSFDANATQTVSTVASASTELSHTAEQMSKIANDTNRQSSEVATASAQASQNVQSVASAAEEMAATVQEISRQITISNSMVQDALDKAEAADASSRELVNMSNAVGTIANMIEDIAGQINLLALNATIESARSGEAGKGFAVVANEVKNLATQTAKATEQIRLQLDGVQKTAVSVADVLVSVRQAIGKVDEISATIAAAVEEQAVATQEIVSNMNTATVGVEQINGGIFSIKGGTDTTTAATQEVLDAARMLSSQAEKMDNQVKSFLQEIQAA